MPKVLKSTCRKRWCLSVCKKINFIFHLFLRCCKDVAHLLFGHFRHAWLHIPKVILSNCRKLYLQKKIVYLKRLSAEKNQLYQMTVHHQVRQLKLHQLHQVTVSSREFLDIQATIDFRFTLNVYVTWYVTISFIPRVFREILQRYTTSYFRYFEHAWLRTPKMILSTCRKLHYCMPKINFIIHFFLEALNFKEYCNLIGWQQIWPITQEPEFCHVCDWWWNINNNISFHLGLFPGKTNGKIFQWIWINIYLLNWKNKY